MSKLEGAINQGAHRQPEAQQRQFAQGGHQANHARARNGCTPERVVKRAIREGAQQSVEQSAVLMDDGAEGGVKVMRSVSPKSLFPAFLGNCGLRASEPLKAVRDFLLEETAPWPFRLHQVPP